MRTALSVAVPFAIALLPCAVACSAGPYGHAPRYAPASGESEALAGSREYDPVMYPRQPEEWRKGTVSLFGVVTARSAGAGGAASLALSVRQLETRNLCESANDEDSCRVTVSDRDFGVVHVLVKLAGDDNVGEHSVGAGSLVRVVGRFGDNVDPNDGGPVLRASWYRHWPRYFFVTSAARSTMRQ